jgi:geranylgeranyl diphosphate synthase type II
MAEMLAITAAGHRELALGQGTELCWMRNPVPLTPRQVLDIFKMKTAPAFEVALRMGAVCGEADTATHEALTNFSEAMGIAYQTRDDIEDFFCEGDSGDLAARRPTLMMALAHECASTELKKSIAAVWCENSIEPGTIATVRAAIAELGVEKQAEDILERHRQKAYLSLRPLRNVELKCILFRVLNRILGKSRHADGKGSDKT